MRKILVIEDNEMNREILKDILCEEYDVLEAVNGAEGLALLEANYQELSVILLDLQMPVMNGFEFLEHVHRDALLSAVPIIVMTADENVDSESRCMALGAVEFLEKPYNPVIMFGRIHNIIRMREAAADIRAIEYDELTGLYTRQAFYHYAAKRLKETPDTAYTLFIVDVREFKLINSLYGEATGDKVLKAIADHLRRDGRLSNGIVGHYGADRFIGLFEAGQIPAEEVLERLLCRPIEIAPVFNLVLKLGVYEQVDRSLSISTIVDRAISALDTVRHSYTNHVGTYDSPLAQKHRQEQQMEADFPAALEHREFEVWFQPKVDPAQNRLVGAEALVRWRKSDGKLVAPGLFIPLFEKDGLVAQLDEYMFREVCRLQSKWSREGRPCFPISINMSRTTLLQPDTVAVYRQIVTDAGTPIELVPIEITESSAFLSDQIGERMKELCQCGFSLHMDDFGSGYSSLTSLGVLPFDVTKIDKSLTDTIGTTRGEMILRHMIEVIHELGMKAVIEGVETAEQVEVLKRFGCDAIQGYYYSRPVPCREFEAMADRSQNDFAAK